MITAPPPYNDVSMMNPKGLKNSNGGAEPDNSSPIAGANRKSTIAGGGLGNLMFPPKCNSVIRVCMS